MSIPTQRAGPAARQLKETGRNEAERKGYEGREMPMPEHARRWDRLANNIVEHSRIPDGARK